VWKIAVGFGFALIVLGVGCFLAADPTKHRGTALIPAYAGAALVLCGAVALRQGLRMHAMHVAALIGLLGFAFPAGRVVVKSIQGAAPAGLALFSQVAMAVICLAFVVMCVRSFVAARRERIS
jgi:hypothetical protein